ASPVLIQSSRNSTRLAAGLGSVKSHPNRVGIKVSTLLLCRGGGGLAQLAIFDRHTPAPTFAFRLSKEPDHRDAITLQSAALPAQSRNAPGFSVLRYLAEHATLFVEALLVQQLGSQLEPHIAGLVFR